MTDQEETNQKAKNTEASKQNALVISTNEISEITGWSPATIMKKARAGLIPYVPLSGKRGIFFRDSFLYWLKNQERYVA